MFAPRNPEASAHLPEDFEGTMKEYDTEEYEMPAKRPRSFHLIKLSVRPTFSGHSSAFAFLCLRYVIYALRRPVVHRGTRPSA